MCVYVGEWGAGIETQYRHSKDSLQELVLFTWAQTACQVPSLLSHFTVSAGKFYVNSTHVRVIWEEGNSIKKMSL